MLPARTKGLRDSAAKSSGRLMYHPPMGISPEMGPEKAASGGGGTMCDNCWSAHVSHHACEEGAQTRY